MDSARSEAGGQPVWHITLLGRLRAARSDDLVIDRFQTHKTAALFAYLALFSERAQEREVLADRLWPEANPQNARRSLSQAASWLRQRLEPAGVTPGSVLITDRHSLQFDSRTTSVDVGAFEVALRSAEQAFDPLTRAAALHEAVSLYTGELLPGFYDDWVLTERRRLADAHLRSLHRLVLHYESIGDVETALRYADQVLAADPHAEEAHEDRIRLLASGGQTAAALRQYDTLERMLRADRDEVPPASVRELVERIRRGQPATAVTVTSPPDLATAKRSSLPAPLTRLFGREDDIARIVSLVVSEKARLITLTGPGGGGKTRLSIESARCLSEHFAGNDIAFVPLADLSDPDLMLTTVVEAVRRADTGRTALGSGGEAPSPWDYLVERLSARPFLLVLDNLEHLLNPPKAGFVTRLVRQFLEEIPTLTILATSRQRLQVEGEHELPVPPLPVPSAPTVALPADAPELGSAGVLLFIDRARAARPDFQITDANAATVVEICAQLEGLPLAIELCAAWAQALTPAQMLARLERRFDLLISRRADISPRHRTLHGAIEYSYQMLSPAQQQLFARLSIFQGGWTLETAEATLGSLPSAPESSDAPNSLLFLSEITELSERSLIVAREEPETGEMRYRMLETLREFAGQQLTYAESSRFRRQHAESFLALAERAETALSGPEQVFWLARLEAEHDNLRAALAWSAGEDRHIALRIASALPPFWDTRGHLREGRDWLSRLLQDTSLLPPRSDNDLLLAKAWSALGQLTWSQGDLVEAKVAHEAALPLWRVSGDARRIARCLHDLGATTYRLGDYAAARSTLEESLAFAHQGNDAADVARAFNNLGNLAWIDGLLEESRKLYRQSLAAAESKGDRRLIATALHNLGTAAGEDKDYPEAERLFQQALAIRRDLKDDYGVMTTLVNLGKTAYLQQEWADARTMMTQAMSLAYDTGRKIVLAYCIKDLGLLALAEGRDTAGVYQLSATLRVSETISAPMSPRHREEYEQALAAARERMTEAAYSEAWEAGRATTIPRIVAELVQEAASDTVPDAADTDAETEEEALRCSHCGAAPLLRHGRAPNGKQRFRCPACGKSTRESPGSAAYDPEIKARILTARREGASLRDLTKRFGVSRNTVMAWLNQEAASPS